MSCAIGCQTVVKQNDNERLINMSNLEHIKSKPADMHTLNSTYKAGNTTYIVNSHFAGKEKIDDLVFEILCKKTSVHSAETLARA